MKKQFTFEFNDGELNVKLPKIIKKENFKEKAIKVIGNKNTQITIKAGIVIITLITFSMLFNKINSFDMRTQTTTQSIDKK
ncbi:hypothetical protein SAMN05192566_0755 [Methylophilus rhizosphaerae]|uniref:Uncharacterized protein n=1 Tax=Methylophilus rhizosphaerae TaxID=492660 RepID=A0A1G9A8Y4_9PROT|nr:hypothetical protein [Methylophilus rhizosphaerae]SDK23816.1 hypothetical protein SAMN05192566_0755 [Methylophilus rhizosphaerae]